jgi:hypothetical protein
MPIDRKVQSGAAFGPEEVVLMKQAFEEVWTTHAGNIVQGHQNARDAIAVAIIKEATRGERNLAALVEAGKRALGNAS